MKKTSNERNAKTLTLLLICNVLKLKIFNLFLAHFCLLWKEVYPHKTFHFLKGKYLLPKLKEVQKILKKHIFI